jgi:hypothetical protein
MIVSLIIGGSVSRTSGDEARTGVEVFWEFGVGASAVVEAFSSSLVNAFNATSGPSRAVESTVSASVLGVGRGVSTPDGRALWSVDSEKRDTNCGDGALAVNAWYAWFGPIPLVLGFVDSDAATLGISFGSSASSSCVLRGRGTLTAGLGESKSPL